VYRWKHEKVIIYIDTNDIREKKNEFFVPSCDRKRRKKHNHFFFPRTEDETKPWVTNIFSFGLF
jgi:hypothetical protein